MGRRGQPLRNHRSLSRPLPFAHSEQVPHVDRNRLTDGGSTTAHTRSRPRAGLAGRPRARAPSVLHGCTAPRRFQGTKDGEAIPSGATDPSYSVEFPGLGRDPSRGVVREATREENGLLEREFQFDLVRHTEEMTWHFLVKHIAFDPMDGVGDTYRTDDALASCSIGTPTARSPRVLSCWLMAYLFSQISANSSLSSSGSVIV